MGGEVVWGVMYAMGILMGGVSWVLYYIMRMAYLEQHETTISDTSIDSPAG